MNLIEKYKATFDDILVNDLIADKIMDRYCDKCEKKEFCHETSIIDCKIIQKGENF